MTKRHKALSNELPRITGLQLAWVEAYCGEARFNATMAARVAGYKDPEQSGYQCRNSSDVLAHVNARLELAGLTSGAVVSRLAEFANASWDEFKEQEFDPKTGQVIRERRDVMPQLKALELLGKHHRLFTENVAISGGIRREIVIKRPGEAAAPLTALPEGDAA